MMTGYQPGTVISTCTSVNLGARGTVVCGQQVSSFAVDPGDSGGPVFTGYMGNRPSRRNCVCKASEWSRLLLHPAEHDAALVKLAAGSDMRALVELYVR